MWSHVECGYDSANETIVFGSRQIAEGDALYETSTVALIRNDGQTTSNPSVHCINRNGKILLAVDNTFRILSNGCTSLDVYASFECSINSFNISVDDQFLILCLDDGSVHCLHIPSAGKLICSTLITESIGNVSFSIFTVNNENPSSFIVCTKQSIYEFKINNIQEVCDQINKGEENFIVNFNFNKLDVNVNPSLTCFKYESNLYYTSNKKCFTDCDNIVIGLDDKGTIIAICKLTKMIYKLYNNDSFKDLMVLKNINSDEHRLLVNSITENGSYISLLSYPNFDIIYNLKVSEYTYLVSIANENDEVMFIEGVCSKGSDYVNELRLKVITESNPDVKLKRLLRRKCFEEAKKFARTFGLDMQQVYVAEAEEYIISNHFYITNVDEFCILLDNIKDVIFIVEQCLINTAADTLENIERMLKYAFNRLQTVIQNNPDDDIFNQYRNRILNLFFKLDTFKILHCNEEFSNNVELIDSWVLFSAVNFFEEMYNYLQNGKIDKCTLLFNRLQQENILDEDKIQNILKKIPTHACLMTFLPLFRHMLLFSLQSQPNCLPIIMNWIHKSVLLYNTDRHEYLLEFCNHINKFLYANEIQNVSFQKNFTQNGCLNKFRDLLAILNELFVLKRDFGIRISVSDFMQESDMVIQMLLDEISLTQLKDFMNKYVFKFCSQRKISVDVVLSHYIKFISATQKTYWDETVICLIPFISSNTLRMETILIVLESADVPWSNTVEHLAKEGSEECHPLASKVKTLKENIPWKMLLKKYSIPEQPNYDNNDVLQITRRILMMSKPDIRDDLNVVMAKHSYLKEIIEVLCFNHFVQNGKMDIALKYLDINPEIVINCFDSALLFAETFIFSNLFSDNLTTSYLEVLPSLLNRLEKSVSEHEFNIYVQNVKNLKNIYTLKLKYGCNEISSSNYDLSLLLPKLIKDIINDTQIDWQDVVKKCEQLSHLLGIRKEECFFELERQTSCLKAVIFCAENIINSDSSARDMCTMAVLLMKNIYNNKVVDNSMNHDAFSITQSTNMEFCSEDISKAFKLINTLALSACINADQEGLQTACEILNWSNGCYWIMEEHSTKFQITPLFHPENICSLSVSTTLVFKDYFDFLLKISGNRVVLPKYLQCCDNTVDEELLITKIDALSDKMKQLHIEGYDLAAYHLLYILKIELMSLKKTNPDFTSKAVQELNVVLNSRFVPQLLDKIFVSKRIDKEFAFSLFLSKDFLPLKWIPCALKKYKLYVKKLHAASSLGCSYMELREIPSKDVLLNLKHRCEWWQKFLHHSISYSDTFQLNPDEIIISLLKSDKFNLKILKEFCHDFGLNMQLFLPLYLQNSLVQWKPKMKEGNITGGEELFEKCKEIISAMENKLAAVEHLNAVWSEISYYQHEVYLCILDLFVALEDSCTNPDKRVLLIFFKDYKRIKEPQQKEIDDWQTKYPFAREIDPLSQYRLPYFLEMCTKDFWEIIRPEINLMTYERWFTNAHYLDLDRDLVCIFAIKGTVDSGVLNSKESHWSTNSKHESLLENMKMCVRQITDLKKATAVLYQAVKKISGGADQVYIAEMCWKKALQWKKATPKSAESETDIHNKCSEVKRKYLHCLTTDILHTYNVGTEKYLNLIENTDQLIKELYHDESIIEKTKGTVMFYPDINSVVDELGRKLGKDLVQIRTSLIMEFLQKSCKIVNFDETFFMSSPKHNLSDEDDVDNICDNLKRVIYICESKDSNTWYELLCSISFAKLDETVSKFATSPDLSMRVKALQCLIIINKNVDELQESIGEHPSSYLEKLQILRSLETLGYSLSDYELDNCNKIDLALKILRTKSLDSTIIKSLAKMCSIYDIWDSNLWNKILQNFVDLKMLADLQEWLPKLYDYCYSPDLDCPLVNGWSCLIKSRFLNALNDGKNYPLGFLVIQVCPIVTMLESCFMDIFNLYFQKSIYEICAMFLPYVQKNKTKQEILESLASKKNSQLYDKIIKLSFQGIFNTDIVIKYLKGTD